MRHRERCRGWKHRRLKDLKVAFEVVRPGYFRYKIVEGFGRKKVVPRLMSPFYRGDFFYFMEELYGYY